MEAKIGRLECLDDIDDGTRFSMIYSKKWLIDSIPRTRKDLSHTEVMARGRHKPPANLLPSSI
jgi:hypothetical protein